MSRENLKKGDYAMNLAAELLEAEGYRVEKAKKVKFQPQDFFGLFDIIAVSNETVRLIQVSWKPIYDKGRAFRRKLWEFPVSPRLTKEYWHYKGTGERKIDFIIKFIDKGEMPKIDRNFTRLANSYGRDEG